MRDLGTLLKNPVWHALESNHRHLSSCSGDACRYPADVAPFAALRQNDAQAMLALQSLFDEPDDFVYLIGGCPAAPGLTFDQNGFAVLQMVGPEEIPEVLNGSAVKVLTLDCGNADEMVELTTLAFPGFFRPRTCEMGAYFGLRDGDGRLVAMAGERLCFGGYREISGVCTHPEHTGKGYAKTLMLHLMRYHRERGLVSWLHVTATNYRAIEVYKALQFKTTAEVILHRVSLSVGQDDGG